MFTPSVPRNIVCRTRPGSFDPSEGALHDGPGLHAVFIALALRCSGRKRPGQAPIPRKDTEIFMDRLSGKGDKPSQSWPHSPLCAEGEGFRECLSSRCVSLLVFVPSPSGRRVGHRQIRRAATSKPLGRSIRFASGWRFGIARNGHSVLPFGFCRNSVRFPPHRAPTHG